MQLYGPVFLSVEPPRYARVHYKAVAVIDGEARSIFDGETRYRRYVPAVRYLRTVFFTSPAHTTLQIPHRADCVPSGRRGPYRRAVLFQDRRRVSKSAVFLTLLTLLCLTVVHVDTT